MIGIIVKVFETVFRIASFLIATGLLISVLTGLQKMAFDSKSRGLTSMLKINQQLVGPDVPASASKKEFRKK